MSPPSSDLDPLLSRIPPPLSVPPMLLQPGVDSLASPAELPQSPTFPAPTWTTARLDAQKRRRPQCIAHRGYKAAHPENTMAAFRGAVKAGAHALETDVHLTKDGVVVLSHDATLKRCFGRAEKIVDVEWKEIEGLRTIAKPHEGMPRLGDLLEYLAEPELEDTWLLLDIKLDNDAEKVMKLIASTLAEHPASESNPWTSRVMLGIWAAKFLPLALKYLPDFPVMHIGFSVAYARHFFTVPNVGFNMLLPILIAPGGKKFIADAKADQRQVLAWTVNERDKMEWCIRRGLDGVITDDPKMFLEIEKSFDEQSKEPFVPISWKGMFDVGRIWLWIMIMFSIYKGRFLPVASKELISRGK
nr:hypothetical protein B0A51_14108 [Rachicladosporium sp. CCFEE 5018]